MSGRRPDFEGKPSAGYNNEAARFDRAWVANAVEILAEERRRAADTPLIRLECPELPAVDIYLKDETAHASGSLKHRLAHALFLHAICSGEVGPNTTIVEASSGSTAISEAWFAQKLGLEFVAVVPSSTALAKIAAIEEMGGEVVMVGPDIDVRDYAARVALAVGGWFMDQFGRAAEATDWRGANNIAQSLFAQLELEPNPLPAWIVVGAGTGGTSATIGRYIRLRPELCDTRLCVVDPEGSAFFPAFHNGDMEARGQTSRIVEGIGRGLVEPGFNVRIIDSMLSITDAASVAAAHWLEARIGRRFGPSTGTNMMGVLLLARAMQQRGRSGSIVTLACDGGERYVDTIFDPAWLGAQGIDLEPWHELLATLGDHPVSRPSTESGN